MRPFHQSKSIKGLRNVSDLLSMQSDQLQELTMLYYTNETSMLETSKLIFWATCHKITRGEIIDLQPKHAEEEWNM